MAVPDPHDRRVFRHFEKVAPDGSVLAIVEVAVGAPEPTCAAGCVFREVTAEHPHDGRAPRGG